MEAAVYIAEKLPENIRLFGIWQKFGPYFVAGDAETREFGNGLRSKSLTKKKKKTKKTPCDTYSDIGLKTQESEYLLLENLIVPLWCADVHLSVFSIIWNILFRIELSLH